MSPLAEYSRGINSSSLILAQEKDEREEQNSVEMFRYNKIPYFLKMHTQEKDGRKQFCYDITGKRSLDQLLDYKLLDDSLLLKILNSFDRACIQAEHYLLTENDILLNPEMVFLGGESESVFYCYLPGNQEDICGQFREFMEYLLQHLDHKNERAVQAAYGIYQHVTEGRAALHDVLKSTMMSSSLSEHTEAVPPAKDLSTSSSGRQMQELPESAQSAQECSEKLASYMQGQSAPKEMLAKKGRPSDIAEEHSKLKQKETVKNQAAEKLKSLLRKKLYTNGYQEVEEESVFEDVPEEMEIINPTVCMTAVAEGIQNLFIFQGTDRTRDFQCTQSNMVIGSSREECDICIPLPMVSRVHARIEINAQGAFLEDMNSTNGTQINGELLKYRKKYMLNKGDVISLAGETYSFH